MGKNDHKIYNLEQKPQLFLPTLKLIEASFQYQTPHAFQIDFAPLMDASNHRNCFILVNEDEEVLAHMGVCERKIQINGEPFTIAMLGGIAVDEKKRGEGLFNLLMLDVLAEKRSDVALFILWSDMEKLYEKFNFYLCGQQFELEETKTEPKFEITNFHFLNESDKNAIKDLYENSFASTYLTLNRTPHDWRMIEKISSAQLYLKRNNSKITDYFFMNKGQDLPGVIYEYGSSQNLTQLLQEAQSIGKVWMGAPLLETPHHQYQFFMTPGDTKLFSNFIQAYTQDKISIKGINLMKQEVYFDFNQELHGLELEEFLRGVFGPGIFEELDGLMKPIFLSGLDSI